MTKSTGTTVGRRTLIAGAAAGLATVAATPKARAADTRKRYVIVGCGSRSRMFQTAIWGAHKDHNQLVAICDTNPGRLAYVVARAKTANVPAPKTYLATDFDKMVRETKPDAVIVTTPDAYHVDYIIKALDAGLDVITEKPMTTDAPKAQAILDAVKRSGRHIRVGFNYRYSPFRSQIKEILMSGVIGDIVSVDYQWLLNTSHGADYFRRWHSNKAISGGLMVHKATHHFDLVNWWLSDMPATVTAVGKRDFYTPQMAKRLGLSGAHERCLTCPEKAACTFQLDLTKDAGLKALYLDNERYDGYFRDRCVFRPEINIEDTMHVVVNYATGTTLNYSLNAFNAWEGYNIAFNGTKGRLEHSLNEQASASGSGAPQSEAERGVIRVIPMRQAAQAIPLRVGTGSHGGGDAVMLNDLFNPDAPADPLMRAADERGGAASILIGVAANRCFETGQPVRIDSLVQGLERPDYPEMPSHTAPVPMPTRS